jgi:CRISPR-associated endonuclease/helicase Cas3
MGMKDGAHWAHVRRDPDSGEVVPHHLDDHLQEVAAGAAKHADGFGADWARFAGLWHDLGKYRKGFGQYIRQANAIDAHIEGRVKDRDKTHSAAGAIWAERLLTERYGKQGRMMARALQYVIAGHHAGLDNWHDGLSARLASADAQRECDEALAAGPPAEVLRPAGLPDSIRSLPLGNESKDIPGRFALWQRMLFSALVDADFLDTEAFLDAGRGARRGSPPSLSTLKCALDEHMAALAAKASDTPVNRLRAAILRQCREKAMQPSGAFTLTVPTGGGKTLASLAFALDHAVRHGKRRVIYAIPYTSIIEQTAEVFRTAFKPLGDDVVIEHHSNAESEPGQENSRSRLACENWDASVVVTTNVQLFESLFARRTSRCRKLHNIAGSVIVLDEAQLLPVEFLQPIVDVLRLLVRDYGATLLLCTATQPVLTASTSADPQRGLRRGFSAGAVTEIIDDVPALYAALRRVRVHLPTSLDEPRAWPAIADDVAQHEAVLAIVSRRADARELFGLIRRQSLKGCWHLSALMCAQHRSDVIAEIKSALSARREALETGGSASPVRVISTQLVEAGVDLDFPVVYRALAGLDSIAQAAGRCNREGRLDTLGDVHVFVPPTQPPRGLLRQARDTCRTLWHDRPEDPFSLALFERYFQRLYHDQCLDKHKICEAVQLDADPRECTLAIRFRDAAEAFRLIDDKDGATVLVRYRSPNAKEGIDALIGLLERDGPSRWLMRKLQRYGVTVYKQQIDALVKAGDVREVAGCPGLYVQADGWDGFYDALMGVNVDGAPGDPAAFVA